MDFSLTDDRRMLSDMLRRFLADSYPADHRARVAYSAPFHDPAIWAQMLDLGVAAALVPEAAGGLGGTGFDIITVFEELGRGLCPEPALPTLLAARLLVAAGHPLDALLSGAEQFAVAIGERTVGSAESWTATGSDADGWRISGRAPVVYGGGSASQFLVPVQGAGLYLIPASDARVDSYAMIDGGGAADIGCVDAPATRLMADADAAVSDAWDHGALALCAEAVGIMDLLQAGVADHLRQRQQFGRPIGSFQVLRHRYVDLRIDIEQARSITMLAASRIAGPDRSRMVSLAKSLVGRVGRLVAEEAIQMQGGIGMTWENHLSHAAKRLIMLDHQLGDTEWHEARIVAGYAA